MTYKCIFSLAMRRQLMKQCNSEVFATARGLKREQKKAERSAKREAAREEKEKRASNYLYVTPDQHAPAGRGAGGRAGGRTGGPLADSEELRGTIYKSEFAVSQGYCDDTLDQDPGSTKRLKHSAKAAAGARAGRERKKSTSEAVSSATDGDADHDYDEDQDLDDNTERSAPASRFSSAAGAASPAAPRLKEQEAPVPFRRRPILEKNWDFEQDGHERSQKNEDDGEGDEEEIEDTDAAWAAAIRKRGHEKSAGMDYYAEDRMDMDTARKNWSFVRTIFKKKGRFAWSGR